MKRHFRELKAMVSSINTETAGGKLVIERSSRQYGAVGFSYSYIIKRWDFSEGGHHKVLLNWAGFGEAYGFLKAMILSLDIQGDILVSQEEAEEKINAAIDRSTDFLKERIKELEREIACNNVENFRHAVSILECDVVSRDDRIRELEDKLADRECKSAKDAQDICTLTTNLHNLRAELLMKNIQMKKLQNYIVELKKTTKNNNTIITNLKHKLIHNPKIGEVSIPTRAAIAAELKRAWDTDGQTTKFHEWCRLLLKKIIAGKMTPAAEDNRLFMEYGMSNNNPSRDFKHMINTKYVAAIQAHLLCEEEDKAAPKLMKI